LYLLQPEKSVSVSPGEDATLLTRREQDFLRMKGSDRLRRLASYAFVAALAVAAISCNEAHPNTTLDPHTDLGREIDFLWDRLLLLGTIVFVLVEVVLIYIVFRYRRRENQATPPQTHGSTRLEIAWTLIPAVILVFIAVPTVRTIFITQAQAAPGSLNIEVTGHQWWWEFRYPDYGVTTANEIYIPAGRTVSFRLRSADVIHSFWAPQLGGKRDVVTNRTNFMWFTPDSSISSNVWNGFCAEYCGASHANMRFRVFTVTQQQFESWVAGQKLPARFGAVGGTQPGYIFPREQVPYYAVPHSPIPPGLKFTPGLTGNAQRGLKIFTSSACIGCHAIAGNPMAMGTTGPNLTHVGSRLTIAAGRFPNAAAYLALWIKNARAMKPEIIMPTLGVDEYDPVLKTKVTAATGGLTDQQIADIVAYLTALK
jgi:cytochrome c oxidase subunit 2